MILKKHILSGVTFLLALLLIISGVLFTAQNGNFGMQAIHIQSNTQSQASEGFLSGATIAPLNIELTTMNEEELGETVTGKLYADNGQEIMFIRETGQLITADGEFLCTVSDNAMARYDDVTQELLDSANRAMKIWFDSVSQMHKLQSDSGKTLKHIKASDMIYISTILDRHDGFTKTIYVTREKFKTKWWQRIFGSQAAYYYKYYDMNGRHIPDSWFTDHYDSSWFSSALRSNGMRSRGLGDNPFIKWLKGVFKGHEPVSGVIVTEAGTLAEITTLLEFATFHPWEKLEGVLTANNDGAYNSSVYINPQNKQLCDRLGAPIYHIETGYPLILNEGKIITIPDKTEQVVTDGILQNGATRQYLRNLGFEEYIHYIDDYEFGIIGVLVLAVKNEDGKLINWTFPNGEDATDIIRGNVGIDTGEDSLLKKIGAFFSSIFNGVAGFFSNIGKWILIGLAVIAGIFLFIYFGPVILFALKVFFGALWKGLKFLGRIISWPVRVFVDKN